MKSKKKQRILALILSMVLMLSASISALAEGDVQTEASGTETTENQAAVQSLEQETVPETEVTTEEGGIDTQSAETSTEPVQENTEQEVTETPAEPEQGVTEETAETTDTTQSQAQSTEVQEESDAAEEIPVEEQPGETTEETATEETVVSEAAELKQEFTDENGNVTQTVTAYVPEGAFQATADQISMEVSLLNTDDTNYIKGMMEELLPENHYLDGYVLYQIDFKVNGEITQPAKAVTITMNGNDLAVEDTQKAHVFYYDVADPEVEGDKDQLIEVIQKDQLLKSLEESGQSTENIEDYDYSEIAVNEGNANTITVKGWESTIYGCYVEKEAVTELTYEDDSVTVTVSADQAGIIPEGAELSVTPITKTEITDDMSEEEKAQAEEINDQYDFTEEQLQKDSEENDTTMEGFLAYDICFMVDGKEVEPSGDVKVVMDFKEAAVPEGVSEDAEVTVKHLKEDESAEDGIVVEDMSETASVETTEKAEVEKVEMTADSFSTYAVAWAAPNRYYEFSTVDTDSTGLQINLYNYNGQINEDAALTEYYFTSGWGLDNSTKKEDGSADESFYQGLVQRNLKNEIPRASTIGYGGNKIGNNESLDYLFSTDATEFKTVYEDITGLFQREGQWYRYDSSTNHAQLEDNELIVYEQALVPQYNYLGNSNFLVGNFLPFNDIEKSAFQTPNKTEDGVDIFNVNETKDDTDLWFGMTIDGTFYQPSNGQINGEDMIFEFAGDDDVWVYIDDVLILDIGGIHGKVSGSINFATGDVNVDGVETIKLHELFKLAYLEEHPNQYSAAEAYADSIVDEDTGRFKDYSLHKMNFFYLERGGGASNCKLDFNLPTLPAGSITVQKEIDNFMEGAYSDIGFQFELYADLNEDGTFEKITANNEEYANYQILDADSTVGGTSDTLGADGIFTLKHNQKAVFSGFPVNTKYYVKEVGITYDEYDDVEITAGNVTDEGGTSDLTSETAPDNGFVQSSVVTVEETPYMVFHNHCNMTELKTLYVQKVLKNNQDEDDSDYKMLVTIDGEPYIGEYTTGTSIESQGTEVKAAENGYITLKAGETARLLGYVSEDDKNGFPAGTSFTVTEGQLDTTIYEDPQYAVSGAVDSSTQEAAAGKLSTESNAVVTVTNTLKATPDKSFIKVQKTFKGLDSPETELPNFKIMVYADAYQNTLIEELTLESSSYDEKVTNEDGSITYIWRINNLDGGTYWIKEEGKELASFDVSTSVNGRPVDMDTVERVTTVTPTFSFSQYQQVTECSATTIPFQANVVAARLTDNTYFVWSEQPLSAQEREAIISAISTHENNWNHFTVENTSFYSGLENGDEGYVTGAGTIYIKRENQNTLLNFSTKDVWRQCISGIYERIAGQNAEIEIVNEYTEKSIAIDLQKFGTSYAATQLSGARFSLYKGDLNDGESNISWYPEPENDYKNFEVSAEGNPELNLTPGYYKLVETTAPDNCILLSSPILFKVENSTVLLVDESGIALSTIPDMWQLVTNESGNVKFIIQIKNEIIYELPSAGGPGIFLYMIGGTLLLMAGSLMIYINRRRGVLRR
ncbi:MAG: hypothetical protein KH330_05320 [Clostridiales bacterium]|nr:hypothetical protein [Clostridiales bacterium]